MLAAFSESLPSGVYAFGDIPPEVGGVRVALAWILRTYKFDRYRKSKNARLAKLVVPKDVDGEEVTRIAESVFFARDLVNIPSNDMGPEQLAAAARDLAKCYGAKFSVIVSDDLLKQNIIGGLELKRFYPELDGSMVVCATEMSRREQMDAFQRIAAAQVTSGEPVLAGTGARGSRA